MGPLVGYTVGAVVSIALAATFRIVKVSGDSMNPGMCDGEIWVATTIGATASAVGDVVVLKVGKQMSVKRVVATSGNSIRIVRGQLLRDGQVIEEPSICENARTIAEVWPRNGEATSRDAVVPSKGLFVLGDNRCDSLDSRNYGFVHQDQVKAKLTRHIWRPRGRKSCDCST